MIKKFSIAALTVFIWIEPASALDFSIQPRFKSGIQYYEYHSESFQSAAQNSQGQSLNTRSNIKIRDWLPVVSGGATVFIDRLFVDFDAQHSFAGEDRVNFDNQIFLARDNSLPTDVISRTSNTMNTNIDRFEWAISVGFEVYDDLVLFAGYKQSNTDFSSNVHGNIMGFQAGNMAPIPFLTGSYTGKLDVEIKYDGPFVGASYNWRIQQGFIDGALAFNFAAAFLDGTVDYNFRNIQANTAPVGDSFDPQTFGEQQAPDSKGDSIGLSFGVTWRGITPVSGLTYSMGVTGYRYDFDSYNNTPDYHETQVRMDFGLAYAFDI
jgi:hypothetical protein